MTTQNQCSNLPADVLRDAYETATRRRKVRKQSTITVKVYPVFIELPQQLCPVTCQGRCVS